MPRATLDRLRASLPNASPYLMYGLTEAFRSTYLDPSQVEIRPKSIGKPIPDVELYVINDEGRECAPREVGELHELIDLADKDSADQSLTILRKRKFFVYRSRGIADLDFLQENGAIIRRIASGSNGR